MPKHEFLTKWQLCELSHFFLFSCFAFVQIVHTRGRQLVPELLLKLSDTLHIQYGNIEHCVCGEFNLYHSSCRNNSILCLHNIDSLNICMKKFDAKKIFFDKITAF